MIQKNFLLFKFFIARKEKIPKIFITSSVKSIHLIPQNAIVTPFSTLVPAISLFPLLILSPEKGENLSNILITSVADFLFLRENLVSSA